MAEKIAKGNAFYTSGVFRDLQPMYKGGKLGQESLDKTRTKGPLQKIESVVTIKSTNEDRGEPTSPNLRRKVISISVNQPLQVQSIR